jgi:hypothetical protein
VADHLQQLLDLFDEPRVKDRLCQFNMSEVARTLSHILVAGSTLVLTVNRSESGVVEPLVARLRLRLVHGLGVEDVANTHILDFLWREQAKLYLLDYAQRRIRMHKVEVRHDEG